MWINGVQVDPIYQLMEKAERREDYLATLPANHPDRPEWVGMVNETYGQILEARKCALS
jgi:hypothetical protein